jgi:LDH2 family malate/lactate/ureidoglycolate dehydrogenase
VWDGKRLPGVWLTARAMDEAVARARVDGPDVRTIQSSRHIARLGLCLLAATEASMIAWALHRPAGMPTRRRGIRTGNGDELAIKRDR